MQVFSSPRGCHSSDVPQVDADLDSVAVIIPVRDEAETIQSVIRSLQTYGLQRILVVDNGSGDRSGELAVDAGAQVSREPQAGYGRACWHGVQRVPSQLEWILFCDGDGSDDLSCLPQMLALRDRCDFILGDRRANQTGRKAMTPVQNFGNELATRLIRLGWGYGYRDLGPLRLIRRSAFDALQMRDRSFGWTVEMQVRAVELNLRICELPVAYRPRQGGTSKISGTVLGSIRAGKTILATLGVLWLRRLNRQFKAVLSRLLSS